MIASPTRLAVAATLSVAAAIAPVAAQNSDTSTQESEIARIRLAESGTQIFQVFIDRKPVTVLYRKDNEVGIEFVADEDGIECSHDVAVVTSDGRLADLPGVNFCESDWIVTVDAARLSGGSGSGSSASAAAPSDRTQAAAGSDENCGWLAIMACKPNSADAERDSTRIMGGVSVISTDDYQGLEPGMYCAAQGPYATEAEAEQTAGFFRGKGAPDAYTRQTCEAAPPPDAAAQTDQSEDPADLAGDADPATAVRELELSPGWNFVPPSDTDNQAVLAYADASSGGPEFVATCGTAEDIAITFYRAPDGAAVGSNVDVSLGAGRFRREYPATVSSDGASVVLSTDQDDPLWRALAAYVRLDIDIGTLRSYSLSLRGSGVKVRPFVDACEQLAAAPAGPDDAGPSDAGAATPGSSARYACVRGPSLEVFFDSARGRAVVSVEGGEPIALQQARSGSGALYRAGGYELHSKAGEAVWTEPGNRQYICRSE